MVERTVLVRLTLAAAIVFSGAVPASPVDGRGAVTSTKTSTIVLLPTELPSVEDAPARPKAKKKNGRPHWPAWLGAGSTILCGGLSLYYRAVAHEAITEAGRTFDMDVYNRDLGDAQNARTLSSVLLITSAASLVGTLIYYFWPSSESED